MTRITSARIASHAALGDIRRRNARARDLLRSSERLAGLDERERAFAMRLVMGVIGAQGLIDHLIDSHLNVRRLQPKVRDALRLGTYELLFLDTPPSAAVSQAVELVRLSAPRAAGLANAVLRKIASKDRESRIDALSRVRQKDADLADMALVSGYPAWILGEVASRFGMTAACDMALSALAPAPVYVASNKALLDTERLFTRLTELGCDPVPTELDDVLELGSAAALAESGLVESAQIVVSDLSAQRVAYSVLPDGATTLLEIGQGRGTKSILIQNEAKRRGMSLKHVGIDSEAFKVGVAKRRMERGHLDGNVTCLQLDGLKLGTAEEPRALSGEFDIVFLDAPCSGTGTLRRHPEIAWSLRKEDISEIVALQQELLRSAARKVKRGGTLVYSTCSILATENEDVLHKFMHDCARQCKLVGQEFQSLPAPGGPDGHYCARMVLG